MTATDVETESIEHLDFEHEVPCDGRDCDHPAEYSLICRSCSHVCLACTACLRWYLDSNDGRHLFDCKKCRASSSDFRALVHIHPLH